MHDDAIVFHNHTVGERVAGAAAVRALHRRDIRTLADATRGG
jgi:hypothetical protein